MRRRQTVGAGRSERSTITYLRAVVTVALARVTPKKLLILHVVLGAAVLITAGWLFGAIAEDVINHDAFLLDVDLRVAHWLHDHATPTLTSVMIWISYLGAPITVFGVAIVSAVILFWRRQLYALLLLLLVLPGGMLLNVLMKDAVARHRPTFIDPLLTLTTYSFPSGHASGSTLMYGVLAALVVWTGNNRRWHVVTTVVAVVLIVLVCVSRIYLGVHYLSDVIAGVLAGIVWVTLCLFAVTTYQRRRMGGDRR